MHVQVVTHLPPDMTWPKSSLADPSRRTGTNFITFNIYQVQRTRELVISTQQHAASNFYMQGNLNHELGLDEEEKT